MIPLTNEGNEYYLLHMQKKINTDKNDKNSFKLYHKVRDHCHCT